MRDKIVEHLDKVLRTAQVADSSVNGLQVEGAQKVTTVGLAVDASLAAYKLAVDAKCQMIIAHHGIIWGGIKSIRGAVYKQIEFLIKNNLNLYASHLPLDMHPTLGNNVLMAKALGMKNLKPFGLYKNGETLGFEGELSSEKTLEKMVAKVEKTFGKTAVTLPFGPAKIKRAAVISGRGSASLQEAVDKKIDLFVTGEPIHEDHHLALEGNISVIYGGHYETEKLGVMALGKMLSEKFDVKSVFLDVPTVV